MHVETPARLTRNEHTGLYVAEPYELLKLSLVASQTEKVTEPSALGTYHTHTSEYCIYSY